MESKQKLAWLIILPLVIGVAIGFSFGKNTGSPKSIEVTRLSKDETVPTSDVKPDVNKKALALRKLDLLKSYKDFISLPREEGSDSTKYVDAMAEKLMVINDNEMTTKFYATGENDNKEQKIADFLDYLYESIKSDLN